MARPRKKTEEVISENPVDTTEVQDNPDIPETVESIEDTNGNEDTVETIQDTGVNSENTESDDASNEDTQETEEVKTETSDELDNASEPENAPELESSSEPEITQDTSNDQEVSEAKVINLTVTKYLYGTIGGQIICPVNGIVTVEEDCGNFLKVRYMKPGFGLISGYIQK